MIRIVNISKDDQVIADRDCFAWFDTITDEFIDFSDNSVWASWGDFMDDFNDDDKGYSASRFSGLYDSRRRK